jgi:hypothetical protein
MKTAGTYDLPKGMMSAIVATLYVAQARFVWKGPRRSENQTPNQISVSIDSDLGSTNMFMFTYGDDTIPMGLGYIDK